MGPAAEQRFDPGAEQVFQGAGEQDHEALDHHDHLPVDRREVERQFGAALVERSEQQGRQDDADGMVAAHQGDRDADEADAAGEAQDQAVMDAQHLVQPDEGGERSR